MSCMGCCYRHEGDLEVLPNGRPGGKSPAPKTTVTKPLQRKKETATNLKDLRNTWKNPFQQPRKTHPAKLFPLLTKDTLSSTPLTASQQTAQTRLRELFSGETEAFRQLDTLLQAALQLDTLLFNSALRDHIAITVEEFRATPLWRDKLVKGRCIVPPGPLKRFHKVQIQLNNTLLVYGSREEVLGTLVHEMLHAYLGLVKGWRHREGDIMALAEGCVRRVGVEGLRVEHLTG